MPSAAQWAACVLAGAGLAAGVQAQIRTDASLGRPPASLSGPQFAIPESLGRLAGANLFHSFETFNLGRGEAARFSTTSPGIANVISRVTGGSPSMIRGEVALVAAEGRPAFFLINPAGVTFGSGASISVPGAFHVGTADYLRFADGRFAADPAQGNSLSVAPPEAFGFLGQARAAVQVSGGARLVTRAGAALNLVAGDVRVDEAGLVAKLGGAGELRVLAVGAEAREVPLTGSATGLQGRVDVLGGARVTVSNQGPEPAGDLLVAAGDVRLDTGGSVDTITFEAGPGADLRVQVGRSLEIQAGAMLVATTAGPGDSGHLQAQAGQLTITRAAGAGPTGIFGAVEADSSGQAGRVQVQVAGDLSIRGGGLIGTATYSASDAGALQVSAQRILVDGLGALSGMASVSDQPFGGGRAGAVEVHAPGGLLLLDGAGIESASYSNNHAGDVLVTGGDILLLGGTAETLIRSYANSLLGGGSGSVTVRAQGDLLVAGGAAITTESYGAAQARGSIAISARNVEVDGGNLGFGVSRIQTSVGSLTSGRIGDISIDARQQITLLRGGQIASFTSSTADAGALTLRAARIVVDGRDDQPLGVSQITSDSLLSASGRAGPIDIVASEQVSVLGSGTVSSSVHGSGEGGGIRIVAPRVLVDGAGVVLTGGIQSSTSAPAGRSGGTVDLQVGTLALLDGGTIRTGSSCLCGPGESGGGAAAGAIRIAADDVYLVGRGTGSGGIFSGTLFSGNGRGGDITIDARGTVQVLHGASIGADTQNAGDAGSIHLRAQDVRIDGMAVDYARIASDASFDSSGRAGSVQIEARGTLSLANGGHVGSKTWSTGPAGTIRIDAARIEADGARSGVTASAGLGSAGQIGQVDVRASEAIVLRNQAALAITNDALVDRPDAIRPGSIRVQAPLISLASGAAITAESSGNVAAGSIDVQVTDRLLLRDAAISTSAQSGDGGAIRIDAARLVALDRSQVSTSVFGAAGDGGDITLRADNLLLRSGFVQANTAADAAAGGAVRIDVQALLASGSNLYVGGDQAYLFRPDLFGFNVVQAAAPTGVSGAVALTAPAFDVAGSLAAPGAPLAASDLARSPCQPGGRSYLSLTGTGGFAASVQEHFAPPLVTSPWVTSPLVGADATRALLPYPAQVTWLSALPPAPDSRGGCGP